MTRVLVAGASGYIGQALINELLSTYADIQITALSRGEKESTDPRVAWKACDLFSLKSLEQAVPKEVDRAFYLVHSMGPTAQMDQGSFADYDLILADNFARVLKPTTVKQVVYLGGLIPKESHLSLHLKSRLEVEETFAEAKLPLTVFRAGLIIGTHGSSFQILSKLVDRLPVMVCPSWTQTLTTPIDLKSVVAALSASLSDTSAMGRIYDLAGCEPLTYVQMMRDTAKAMGRKRYFLTVPFFTPTLSRLWVRLITGAPKELVYPLVESLEHAMIARPDHLYHTSPARGSYADLLAKIDLHPPDQKTSKAKEPFRIQRNTVRSVQRLPLPPGRDAEWVKDQYAVWLPKFLAPFIKVATPNDHMSFSLLTSKAVMLDLVLNRDRSSADRQLLYVKGGLLSAKDNKGRLEFREVLNRKFILAAIHEFKPSLPWPLYRLTQAIAHVWVMRNFSRYLGTQ